MKLIPLVFSAMALLAGCASPVPHAGGAQSAIDKDTSYSVEERPDGMLVAVAYSRYQFIPESAVVQTACIRALTATAYDVAEKRGRKIEPVNEQRIKVSMGRNGLAGTTSCEASVPVAWAK